MSIFLEKKIYRTNTSAINPKNIKRGNISLVRYTKATYPEYKAEIERARTYANSPKAIYGFYMIMVRLWNEEKEQGYEITIQTNRDMDYRENDPERWLYLEDVIESYTKKTAANSTANSTPINLKWVYVFDKSTVKEKQEKTERRKRVLANTKREAIARKARNTRKANEAKKRSFI
jgi:hypothetical protein